MIDTLRPYQDYAESGQAWLGVIPQHWTLKRGKALFAESRLPVRTSDEIVTCFRDGQVTLRRNRRTRGFMLALQEAGYQGVRKGQLVIHAMDAFAGAIGVSDSDGKCTPEYVVCAPRSRDTSPEYFAMILRVAARTNFILATCPAVRERAPRFRYPSFGDMTLPSPPPDEQNDIVRFIDHANRQFQRVLQSKRKVIALLDEHKQSAIDRAVTRGLAAGVPLKSSGIPRVGDIPAHWELRRAKQLCAAIVDCKNRTPPMVRGGAYTVVRTTNIRHSRFNLEGSYTTNRRNYEVWTQRGAPQKGDVFFTREAPVGEACLVPNLENLCMGQRMMYFRPNPEMLDARFMLHSIYGPVIRTYVAHVCNGSTVDHLRLGQVSSLPLLWCPLREQEAIVEYIDRVTAPLDIIIAGIEREMTLIREYWTRLSADVVTGKLDVRQAARNLPTEPDDVEPMAAEEDLTDPDAAHPGDDDE